MSQKPPAGVYILSLDAKDIHLANKVNPSIGYNVRDKDGEVKLGRYINVLDYSLDLIKLKEVYKQVIQDRKFTFKREGKEYCPHVINVTFQYCNKLFNRVGKDFYVRSGYAVADNELVDGICFKDGQLIGVKCNYPIENPLPVEELEKSFFVEDGMYKPKNNIPVLHSVSELRAEVYRNGFMCDGQKFVRFKRSSGSSRVGKCLFINEKLYEKMHEWEMCGLDIKEGDEIDLAALEAYIALTLSSIIDTLTLHAHEILVIDDYTSVFKDKVVVTDVENGKLRSYPSDITIENSIWDGQSLIDASLCSGHGMALLRNRFFKSCCFSTNIQQFFADNGITSVEQLNGHTWAKNLSDIKLITTPSSIKYLKFGSLEQWLSNLETTFGVVKHEKQTHFFNGRLVQAHYQLINTLELTQQEMDEFIKPTLEYVRGLRYDPAVMRYHLKLEENHSLRAAFTKSDMAFELLTINSSFCNTTLYYDFMRELINSYLNNTRCGRVLIKGNYSTLFGNPYEMLLQSIGRFDGTSLLPCGSIHSTNFAYNQTLLGSRSPHVCMGNIWLANNIECEILDKYFNLTTEIVCINSINENVLMRLSGCDFDSDTAMLTDNPILIKAAQKNYDKFLVPTSAVEAKKTRRYYTNEEKADLDVRTSENKIGEIINLAQLLNTLFWHRIHSGQTIEENLELYCDVAKLDVMSGIEIDKAKKEFIVNVGSEIKEIKKKYFAKDKGEKNIKPNFFGIVAKKKGYYDTDKNTYQFHDTSMDYLQHSINRFGLQIRRKKTEQYVPFASLLSEVPYDYRKTNRHQIQTIKQKFEDNSTFIKSLWARSSEDIPNDLKKQLSDEANELLIHYIEKLKIHHDTMVYLIRTIEQGTYRYRQNILKLLFATANKSFHNFLINMKEPMYTLVDDPDGNIEYYGLKFSKKLINKIDDNDEEDL